ncbi:hypothetical protein Cgig2_031835 [Carnegiea gigantea]|uniref:AB hydrolase-1 domain-containing protein n=1 Tax=Carnegiea gigantea TaxID=171969 RepID=A0A9Q1QNN2_9CARY|nr:hypothetical protein Cgig2_031835 [Carnegiea gigantea]
MQGGGIFEALNGNIYGNMTNSQTLVLAHRFGSSQCVWHNLVPFLGGGCCLPSEKYLSCTGYVDDLLGVLEELNVKKVVYLGHSTYAMIGCIAAVKKPQLCDQLIMLVAPQVNFPTQSVTKLILHAWFRYLNNKGCEGGFEKSTIKTILQEINQNYTTWVQTFAPKAIGMNDINAI